MHFFNVVHAGETGAAHMSSSHAQGWQYSCCSDLHKVGSKHAPRQADGKWGVAATAGRTCLGDYSTKHALRS